MFVQFTVTRDAAQHFNFLNPKNNATEFTRIRMINKSGPAGESNYVVTISRNDYTDIERLLNSMIDHIVTDGFVGFRQTKSGLILYYVEVYNKKRRLIQLSYDRPRRQYSRHDVLMSCDNHRCPVEQFRSGLEGRCPGNLCNRPGVEIDV